MSGRTYRSPRSLPDALPISPLPRRDAHRAPCVAPPNKRLADAVRRVRETRLASAPSRTHRTASASRLFGGATRSEKHTSELQSLRQLVCRPLLEKKNHNSTI